MASVITVRIPDALKDEMARLGKDLNWSEEVRRLLEKRVRQLANMRAMQLFAEVSRDLTPLPRGTAARMIREDRDAR